MPAPLMTPGGRLPPTPLRPVEVLGRSGSEAGTPPARSATAKKYYVDFVNGSDSNNGLGPDASDATNKPWKTITKALGAAGVTSGDQVFLAPGTYRETVAVAMTSATVETTVSADPANIQGFKTSAAVRVAPGPVVVTAYTTDDTTTPSGTTLLNLSGCDFLTFRGIEFVGGSTTIVTATSATSTNITFQDCAFTCLHTANQRAVNMTAGYGISMNWLFDRCQFLVANGAAASGILITATTGGGDDWDLNVNFNNCWAVCLWANVFISVVASGALGGHGGGVRVRNMTYFGGAFMVAGSNTSTKIPCTCTNSLLYVNASSIATFKAATAGQVTEDYNLVLDGAVAYTLVTQGAHTVKDGHVAARFWWGQERIWGFAPKPFGEPMPGSPMLAWVGSGDQTAYDFRGNPRPAGDISPRSAVGALERGNSFGQETVTYHTGANAISITGPGYQDFDIPVDATSTTVSLYILRDGTYAGSPPQMVILNGEECGVQPYSTFAAASVANTWEQLSYTFTPVRAGIITMRLVSNDNNGGGKVVVDDFLVV